MPDTFETLKSTSDNTPDVFIIRLTKSAVIIGCSIWKFSIFIYFFSVLLIFCITSPLLDDESITTPYSILIFATFASTISIASEISLY